MSKNASIIILNELKQKRDEIEKKYQKQRDKKPTKQGISLYALGFIATILPSIIFLSEISIALVGITALAYNLIVPFTYFSIKTNKETKLQNELINYNRKIDRLELEIFSLKVNHHYIENPKQYLVNENKLNKSNTTSHFQHEEDIHEDGPKLKRSYK